MSIASNIENLKKSIPKHVSLIAVSKTKSVTEILEALNAEQYDFGENYVQELIEKQALLPSTINWHFIGHLQTNKVKFIAPFVHLIHSVDSIKLLTEINKQALKNNRIINCLLQIYVGNEETKFGLLPNECEEIINSSKIKNLENIRIIGLMAMASNTNDVKQITNEFAALKTIFERLKKTPITSQNIQLSILSMGMSTDYELAIKCGSNMVRLGSLIFGQRNYN
ncbi:MAG: YggS family pyridoxal phosphate-dependent enzyme [Bacteroidetes bacterium]|nr:YggS family pyridoxal phosphate-dependent enzyme [Bacteroidota bacterium]